MAMFWKRLCKCFLYFVSVGEKNPNLSGIWDHEPCFSEIA